MLGEVRGESADVHQVRLDRLLVAAPRRAAELDGRRLQVEAAPLRPADGQCATRPSAIAAERTLQRTMLK